MSGLAKGIYNLGNGNGFSVKEVIKSVERITGKNVPVKEEPRRQGDPAILIASAERAKRELNWRPEYTNLDDIIRTAWNWHCKKIGKSYWGGRSF